MTSQFSFGSLFFAAIFTVLLLVLAVHLVSETGKATTARPPGMNNELEPVELNPGLYIKIILAVITAIMALALLGAGTWRINLWSWSEIGFNLGFPLILVSIGYLAKSFRAVAKDCRGTLYFYGIALKNVGPGPHFVPWGLVTLETQPIDVQEIDEPGDRNKIFWGDEKEEMPAGMVRPIFVNSRSAKAPLPGTELENAPLDTQLQYGVAYYLFWTVSDDVATFQQNSRTIAEADSQLRKMSVSQLTNIVGTLTAEGAIAKQENTNERFKDAVCARAIGMGVRITDAGITDINLSHQMARLMRDRAGAQFAADTKNIETTAEENRIRKIGFANAEVQQAQARAPIVGRSEGLIHMKKGLEVSGEAALASEVLLEGWPKSTVLAGAGAGSSDLVGAVGAAAATFAAMQNPDKPAPRDGKEKTS